MYLCKEGDSLFGYYYYPNKHYDDAPKNKKYTRYILFEGTIDSDMQTFSVKSIDAVLNKCDYYGTFANGDISGTARSYSDRKTTISFTETDD